MISILSPGFSKQPVTATVVDIVFLSSPRKLQGEQLGPGNAGSRIISSMNPLEKITLIFGIPVLLHPPLEYPTTSIQGGSKKKRAFFNSYKIIKMRLILRVRLKYCDIFTSGIDTICRQRSNVAIRNFINWIFINCVFWNGV